VTALPNRSFLSRVLIGRASQVEEIRQVLTSSERPGTLIVSGEAGIGKSRLVLEARQMADSLGSRVLQGNCFERDAALPYSAVSDLLRGLLDSPATDVEPLLAQFGPEIVKLVPEVAARNAVVSPSDPLDAEQERRRLFHAVSQLLVQLSRERPLLVVVEDLHWADETTLDFLLYCCRHVAASTPPPRVHFLLTYRAEDARAPLLHALAELDRLRLAEEMRLDQLTRAETEVMVRAILELNRPLRRDFLEEIFRLTDGNPFFVEEVLKSLTMTTDLEIGDEAGREAFNSLAVPRSVNDSVTRRAAQLSAEARRLLEVAAVTGQRFDLALLHSVLATEPATLVDQVKELVAAQLVMEESAGRFRFRHALTREAVSSSLLSTERIAYHRAIADAIEAQGEHAGEPDGRLVDLAHHFYMAGVWPKAQLYCEQAGRRAQDLYAPAACIEHLSHAIEAATNLGTEHSPSLLRVRAGAYEMLGEFNKALADLESALASAREAGDRVEEWEALLGLGVLWLSRDYERAGAFFQAALDLAEKTGDRRRVAHSLNRVGNWQMNRGDPPGALARHNQALAIFEDLLDAEGLASTLDLLGMASYHSVKLADEMSYHGRAVELFRDLGNRQGAVSSLSLLAVSSTSYDWPAPPSSESELSAAIRAGEEALAEAQRMGWRAGESFACYTLGMTLGCIGDYRRAVPLAREALRIAVEIQHEQWHVAALRGLGDLYLDLLDPGGARELLQEGLVLAQHTKSDFWIGSISASLAKALVALGKPLEASSLLPPVDEQSPLVLTAWHLGVAHIETALALKDYETVLRLTDRFEATVWPDGRPSRLSVHRAEALLALQRTSEASQAVDRILGTSLLPKPLRWQTEVLHGRIEAALGRRAEAARAYRGARMIVAELAGAVEDQQLQATFMGGAAILLPRTRPETEARAVARERFGGLTGRECEIAGQIAMGHSNREIAEALFLSERTIAVHVANVLGKLGFSSRTQVAAWATANGLVDSTNASQSPVNN
jgi:tetratricopeptide (TPR) repeat protein